MAGRILVPDLRAFDANGDPISGAKLYSFESGTTTTLALYTTEALDTEHTNPVVADSAGRFPDLWAAPDVAYRIYVSDGSETSFAGATAINDTDPVYAQGAGVNPESRSLSSTTTLTSEDLNRRIGMTGTWTLTLPLGSTLTSGWTFRAVNEGTGTITVAVQGGDLVNGASSLTMVASDIVDFTWTGTAWKGDVLSSGVGRHGLWVPAEAMLVRVTNGPGVTVDETTTNKVMRRTLDFDASTIEYAQFRLRMPKSWNRSTVTFAPAWSHGSTTTNFKVSWGLQAVALSDDDAMDAAFGTAQFSNDTGGTTDDLYIGPESSAITIAGTPASEDVMVFQVFRKADDATNDTLAVDARLIGLTLYLTTNAPNDY
jgi:hypothetical protein